MYSRLTAEAAKFAFRNPPKVKTEPGTEPEPQPVAPPLPALSSLGEYMPAAGAVSVPVSVKKAEADAVEVVESKCVLQEILGDVYFVKAELAKTPLEQAELQVSSYKEELVPAGLKENPLTWWKSHEHVFPLLANLATSLLCIPSTSVPSERVFSAADDTVTQQRSLIKPEHVDMLVFLKKNLQKKTRPKKMLQ